jgi:hypothetical protein
MVPEWQQPVSLTVLTTILDVDVTTVALDRAKAARLYDEHKAHPTTPWRSLTR